MANKFILIQNVAYRKKDIKKFWHEIETRRTPNTFVEYNIYYIMLYFVDDSSKEFHYSNKEEWERDFMNLFNEMNK